MFPTISLVVMAIAGRPAPSIEPAASVVGVTVEAPATLDRQAFRDAMRKLWEDHVVWTRLYIVSAIAGLPDASATAARLLQNQTDIGDAIKPFYGDAAGERLTALLKPHILIAAELVTAARNGKTADIQSASARWYANANEIADFLSAANPRAWPRDTMRHEMKHHLDLTLQEAQARLRGDWTADIAAYDAIHQHILGMADVLSSGIMSQFAQRFN